MRDEEGRIVQWYGLSHDIDDQVHAEDALRQASDELAKATKAASLAELSASIAHEVNQPLAAIVANGHACLRWLAAQPPNLVRAKEAAERVVRDGKEAGAAGLRVPAREPATLSATQQAQTAASIRELLARRLAPCKPVDATSPQAQSPATLLRPCSSTAMPPML